MIPYRQKENELSFAMIIDFLNQFKWPVIIVTALAGVLAVIFSMPYFMHPKFESKVILYPATTNSISKSILDTRSGTKVDILEFGEEAEAEQLLQILQSDFITNNIIKKYNLKEHYKVDKNNKYPNSTLSDKFYKNVHYRRTEYSSIEISVLDESADTAALIANDIAALADTAKNNVQKDRAKDALAIVESKYFEKMQFIDNLVDSLSVLGSMGVYDMEQQSSVISEQYAKALFTNNPKIISEIQQQKDLLGKYGPIQRSLANRIEFENEELARLRDKYEQAKVDASQILPASFIINKAYPSEKKAYPLRSLIVLISMASTFVAAILFLALFQNYRNFKKNTAIEEADAKGISE